VTAVRASWWWPLSVVALLTASRESLHEPTRVHACGPASCTLTRPAAAERAALAGEADRLLTRYAGDSTLTGRACHALGAAMRDGAADVRMLAFMWRAPDPDGQLAPVTGDAHPIEPDTGAGRVHIARGFDPLNPDRGLPAILQTARHEFAHLIAHHNQARRQAGWEPDAAEHLATACGPT